MPTAEPAVCPFSDGAVAGRSSPSDASQVVVATAGAGGSRPPEGREPAGSRSHSAPEDPPKDPIAEERTDLGPRGQRVLELRQRIAEVRVRLQQAREEAAANLTPAAASAHLGDGAEVLPEAVSVEEAEWAWVEVRRLGEEKLELEEELEELLIPGENQDEAGEEEESEGATRVAAPPLTAEEAEPFDLVPVLASGAAEMAALFERYVRRLPSEGSARLADATESSWEKLRKIAEEPPLGGSVGKMECFWLHHRPGAEFGAEGAAPVPTPAFSPPPRKEASGRSRSSSSSSSRGLLLEQAESAEGLVCFQFVQGYAGNFARVLHLSVVAPGKSATGGGPVGSPPGSGAENLKGGSSRRSSGASPSPEEASDEAEAAALALLPSAVFEVRRFVLGTLPVDGVRVTVHASEDQRQRIYLDGDVESAFYRCGFRWFQLTQTVRRRYGRGRRILQGATGARKQALLLKKSGVHFVLSSPRREESGDPPMPLRSSVERLAPWHAKHDDDEASGLSKGGRDSSSALATTDTATTPAGTKGGGSLAKAEDDRFTAEGFSKW